MAEALSLAASIIAIIGVAQGVANTLTKIKNIRNAPDKALALINEVSNFRVVLETVRRSTAITQLPETELSEVASLVERAKDVLLELDNLTHYQLLKLDSGQNGIKVSYFAWVRERRTSTNFSKVFETLG
ncbi:MAG: hypothetical protein MMC33_009821 [Icmadophila ericetorum]|nr:hypothetical protein [Icmadophila ericetorum]